jgi:hypothetical protein
LFFGADGIEAWEERMTFSIRCFIKYSFILAAPFAFFFASCRTTPYTVPTVPSSDSASTEVKREIDGRQSIYMAYLWQEGFSPDFDTDGDIIFKKEGRTYFVTVGKNDTAFLDLLLPNIWSIKSDAERTKAANAVSFANGSTKVAKTYISGETDQWVSIALEMYLENPDDFKILFSRMLRVIDAAEKDFISKMQ